MDFQQFFTVAKVVFKQEDDHNLFIDGNYFICKMSKTKQYRYDRYNKVWELKLNNSIITSQDLATLILAW